jgi:hypothetical protein
MNNSMITLIPAQGRLFVDVNGLPDEELIAGKDGRFVSAERPLSFRLLRAASGEVEALELTQGGAVRRIPRIGPLFPERTPSDPDPALTSKLSSALQAFAAGGAAVTESPLLTAGARGALARPVAELRDARALTFAAAQDVTGRGIERHGHAIARVLHYRVDTPAGVRLVLIHLDPAGLVADYDVVSR